MGVTGVGAVTQRDAMQERLDDAVAELPLRLRAKGVLLKGPAAEELLKEAELGVDLLIMGSRGHGPLGRVLLGGVSATVMRSAPCPVLVMPRSAGDPGGRDAVPARRLDRIAENDCQGPLPLFRASPMRWSIPSSRAER